MANAQHKNFLKRALDLSRRSLDEGGFPVASLLVRGSKEISFGLSCTETTHDITAHGEMQAIRAAGSNATGPLTLYSTLEPCLMCLAASAWAGVTCVVYGCKRTSVNPAYYINSIDAEKAAELLVAPPSFLYIPEFEAEVLGLVGEYEKLSIVIPAK